MFSPIVITSRAAQRDVDKIKSKHSLLLQGMADHNVRIQSLNTQKAAAMASERAVQGEMEKEKMASDTDMKKHSDTMALKQAELSIKMAALTAE